MKLSTFAVPLSGNKGSASMFIGLKDAFEKSKIDADFAVFSYYPERDAKIASHMPNVGVYPGHPVDIAFKLLPALILSKLVPFLVPAKYKSALDALAQSDVVLLVGGTTFADSMWWKTPWNLLAALPAILMKKPIVFVSQTLGPFNNPINRILAKWTLKRAESIHGRGRTSTNHAAQLLSSAQVRYAPDLSFSMAVPPYSDVLKDYEILSDLEGFLQENKDHHIIGMTPNSIVFEKCKAVGIDYMEFLSKLAHRVLKKKCVVVLIPHSYREGKKGRHNNDTSICEEFLSLTRDVGDRVFYINQDLSSPVLRALMGRLDLLIASRFHSMISSLYIGTPPLTIGWGGQKYIEVLTEFEVPELYVDYSDITVDGVVSKLDWALGNHRSLVSRISENKTTICKQADRLPKELVQVWGRKGDFGGVDGSLSH